MGLDTTHDAFHGAYSAFNRFRQCVAAAVGASYPPHYVYGENGEPRIDPDTRVYVRRADMKEEFVYFPDDFDKEKNRGLVLFFKHSDCDGEISPDDCGRIANELENILPKIAALNWKAYGHIAARGGFVGVTEKFIAGCRRAAAEGVALGFH